MDEKTTRKRRSARTMTALLGGTAALAVGCEAPVAERPPFSDCSVESTEAQAITVLSTVVSFLLGPELGGLRCVPGTTAVCEDTLAASCVGSLDAPAGVEVTTSITLENRGAIVLNLERVAIVGPCADWQIGGAGPNDVPLEVAPGETESMPIVLVGTAVGTCEAFFEVESDAGNVGVDGLARVRLVANVVDAAE